MQALDALAESIGPLDESVEHTRGLITALECCHHKALRRVERLIDAIGSGDPRRPATKPSPRERQCRECIEVLDAWCQGTPEQVHGRTVAGVSAEQMLDCMGQRTALKIWQVHRVGDALRRFREPADAHRPLMRQFDEQSTGGDDADSLKQTVETVIRDTANGHEAHLPLATAIDHLNACNWSFMQNLLIVLRAIGGDLVPDTPFACCGRNIWLNPARARMKVIVDTLAEFCEPRRAPAAMVDTALLDALGESTPVKLWLAASLCKTIRSQLSIP